MSEYLHHDRLPTTLIVAFVVAWPITALTINQGDAVWANVIGVPALLLEAAVLLTWVFSGYAAIPILYKKGYLPFQDVGCVAFAIYLMFGWWAILGAISLAGLPGAFLYKYAKNKPEKPTCPECKARNEPGATKCQACGSDLTGDSTQPNLLNTQESFG